MNDENQEFSQFLEKTFGQKEVALIIAKTAGEIGKITHNLIAGGFIEASGISELFETLPSGGKFFYVVGGHLNKDMYDFAVQYPTGQVEIFYKDTNSSKIINPIYDRSAIAYLLTKEQLASIQSEGKTLLDKVGLTFQS